MSIRNLLVGAAATACAFSAVAPAAAQQRLIHDFDLTTLTPLLNEFGMSWSYVDDMDGVLRVDYDGNVILLEPAACGDTGCLGLQIAAMYPAGRSIASVNEFNKTTLFAAAVHEDNAILINRYLIADNGFSVPSLKQNIEIFSLVMDNFAEFDG